MLIYDLDALTVIKVIDAVDYPCDESFMWLRRHISFMWPDAICRRILQ